MGGVYLMTPTPVGSVWVIFDSTSTFIDQSFRDSPCLHHHLSHNKELYQDPTISHN
jgi:hypothetical protein